MNALKVDKEKQVKQWLSNVNKGIYEEQNLKFKSEKLKKKEKGESIHKEKENNLIACLVKKNEAWK